MQASLRPHCKPPPPTTSADHIRRPPDEPTLMRFLTSVPPWGAGPVALSQSTDRPGQTGRGIGIFSVLRHGKLKIGRTLLSATPAIVPGGREPPGVASHVPG